MTHRFASIPVWFLLFVISFSGFSQNRDKAFSKRYCVTDDQHIWLLDHHKEYSAKSEALNKAWVEWSLGKKVSSSGNGNNQRVGPPPSYTTTPVTLPVIFHLMTSATNTLTATLTKPQLQSALGVLNQLFAGSAVGNKPAGLNTYMQFCLAEVNSRGASITSYTYTNPLPGALDNSVQTDITALSNVVQSTGNYPTTKYINIYVVDNIVGADGFAYLPPAHGSSFDGIYIKAQWLTGTGTTLAHNITILTHEMGHYLGLFHTFGICKPPLTQACSCDNYNCLFDGDMVCDTPPDFSTVSPSSCTTPTNTCHTDVATISDGTGPTTDVNDLNNNYMDYGNQDCFYSFTNGQAKRMHFMVDEFIGPRNSLLHSSVCTPACANTTCTVTINPITTTTVSNVYLPNTLIRSGATVSFNFTGTLCNTFYNTISWKSINLSNNTVVQTGTAANFNATFAANGNYRIILKASNTSNICEQSDTLDIQVLPPASCPNNLDMSNSWNTNWQRIQYEGGWARNTDGTFAFPTTTMTVVSPTVANSTANSSPFSMVTSLSADPNFSTTALPAGITKVMRVGKVITASGGLTNGDAAYVTFTFSPTQTNSKIRVYYLGMKEQDNGGAFGSDYFEKNIQMPTTFGFVCNYKFKSINGGLAERGILHTGATGNIRFGINDMVAGAAVHNPSGYTTVQIGTNSYNKMRNWEFLDLDFSPFTCTSVSPTITITFLARSDNSTTPGYKHSYAYFAATCLPDNFTGIDLNLTNKDIACANNITESCATVPLPAPYKLDSRFNWGYYLEYNDMLNVNVESSNDNISYTPYTTSYHLSTSGNFTIPNVDICKAPDNNPYRYFKITYSDLCETKTDTISIFQGYVHNLTCAPNSTVPLSGGHYINPPVPPATISPDAYIQFCGTTTLNLTPPCWWHPGDPEPEYKWMRWGGTLPGATSASLALNDGEICGAYQRMARYYDSYCGSFTWIGSDVFKVTDLTKNLFYTTDIKGSDACANQPATISLKNIYEYNSVVMCDEEMIDRSHTTPTINSLTMSFFSGIRCTPASSLTASSGPSVLTFTCLNYFSQSPDAYSSGPINSTFTFNNNGIYSKDSTIYIQVNVSRFGCISTFTLEVPIKIKSSAIAGTITPVSNGCLNPTQITGNDANVNVLTTPRYQWQYSYTFNFTSPVTISGATGFTCNLPAPATFTTYPVYIRRVSLGTSECPQPAYSNTVILNSSSYNLSVTASATTICQGNTVTLSASGASTYTWMPGNVTGAVKTFTPATSTVYTVTGATSNNCTATNTISIVVQPNNTPTITASSSSVCAGSSVTLTASGSSTFTWTGGGVSTTANPRVVTPSVTTTYTVTNVCGSTKTITIMVSQNPTLTPSPASPSVCLGSSVTLSASGTYTSAVWTGGEIINYLENPALVRPGITTTYTVTATNMAGCQSTNTLVVTVLSAPTLSIAPVSPTICSGNSVTLTGSGALSYTWTGGTTGTSNVNPRTVNPTISTVYTLTGANAAGCTSTKAISVTVVATPSLTITPLTATICSGGTTTLTAGGANSYSWSNGTVTSTLNPFVVSPNSTTVYTVKGIGTNGCTSTNAATVMVLPSPKIAVSPASSTICNGATVTLTPSAAVSYTWNSSVSGSTNTITTGPLSVSPNVTTQYTVTGANANGCTASATVEVTVNPKPSLESVASSSVCLGNTGSISVNNTTPGFIYSLSPLPTNTIIPVDGQLIFYVTPTITTVYTITVVNPATGCVSTATSQVYVLPAIPAVTLSSSANPVCAGSSVTLTASGAAYYGWTGGGLTSTSATVVVTPTITTKYTVYGSNTSFSVTTPISALCYDRAIVNIMVLPNPTVSVSGSASSVCAVNCATLTATGASTYSWSTGVINPSITVCPNTTTSYTVTGTDANGCQSSKPISVTVGAVPVLSIVSSGSICSGGMAKIAVTEEPNITYTISPATYSTTTASGSVYFFVNPLVTTIYTVTATNTITGCKSMANVTIAVIATPTITLASSSSTICAGNSVTLTASGAPYYYWPGLNVSTTTSSVVVTPTVTTIYSVTGSTQPATNTDSGVILRGCYASRSTTITVIPNPTVTVSALTPTICIGSSTTLTASGANTYTWTTGTVSSTVNPITVMPTVSTTYTVTGSNGGGCVTNTIITINVLPHDDKPISIGIKTSTMCSGDEYEISASGASTYTWTSSPASAITQSVTGSSIYGTLYSTTTFTVEGTESNGCKEQTSIMVTVLPTPTISVAASPTLICVKNTATLTATGAQSYTWTSNPIASITQNSTGNPKTTNALEGNVTFTVSGTAANGCVGITITTLSVNSDCGQATDNCKFIQCIDGYIPFFRYQSPTSVTSNSVSVKNGSMYMNQIGVPFGIYTPYCPTMATHTVSYSWTLVKTAGVNAPQTICTNVMTKDFSWTNLSAGMYSLTMNMIIQQTINGVTYSCTLTRTSQFGIGTGYFTTPPVLKTISGETLPSANWQVYPNPAIGILYISNVSNDGEQISNIQLFGVDGKELSIEYHKMDRNLLEVYLKDLPNGLYYLRMVTDINTYNRTIAIQK